MLQNEQEFKCYSIFCSCPNKHTYLHNHVEQLKSNLQYVYSAKDHVFFKVDLSSMHVCIVEILKTVS